MALDPSLDPVLDPDFDRDLDAAMRDGMAVAFWARRDPSRPAIVAPTGDLTFGELNADANRLCRALRRGRASTG